MSTDDVVKSFTSLGLSEQKAKETLKNASVTKTLQAILHEVSTYFLNTTIPALLTKCIFRCGV